MAGSMKEIKLRIRTVQRSALRAAARILKRSTVPCTTSPVQIQTLTAPTSPSGRQTAACISSSRVTAVWRAVITPIS